MTKCTRRAYQYSCINYLGDNGNLVLEWLRRIGVHGYEGKTPTTTYIKFNRGQTAVPGDWLVWEGSPRGINIYNECDFNERWTIE